MPNKANTMEQATKGMKDDFGIHLGNNPGMYFDKLTGKWMRKSASDVLKENPDFF